MMFISLVKLDLRLRLVQVQPTPHSRRIRYSFFVLFFSRITEKERVDLPPLPSVRSPLAHRRARNHDA